MNESTTDSELLLCSYDCKIEFHRIFNILMDITLVTYIQISPSMIIIFL